jgi:hypothetical protein
MSGFRTREDIVNSCLGEQFKEKLLAEFDANLRKQRRMPEEATIPTPGAIGGRTAAGSQRGGQAGHGPDGLDGKATRKTAKVNEWAPYRSRAEWVVAVALDFEQSRCLFQGAWFYEPLAIRISPARPGLPGMTYTPDFVIMAGVRIVKVIEVKGGYWREDARVKFKAACNWFQVHGWRCEVWTVDGNEIRKEVVVG